MKFGKTLLAGAAAMLLGGLTLTATPAEARDGWRHHHRGPPPGYWHRPPPRYYRGPPRVYYAPPPRPRYYQPRPYYYHRPPPGVYYRY